MAVYDQYDPNDPFSILGLGQQYNPYQGYPLKQVSDQVWDLIAPTPDYLVAQQFGAMTPWRDDFSTDAFFNADPLLRGPLAQALSETEGDTIGAYNYLQSDDMRKQMLDEIGRTEWNQIAAQGDLGMLGALTSEEKDQAGLDYYMRGLEGLMASGAPTSARNMAQYDMLAERMGGRPYPGAGQGYPEFSGAGFDAGGGGSDPLAALAGSPAYGGQGIPTGGVGDYTTGFGEGIVDEGAAEGPDRLDFSGTGRYAIIGGRRLRLPDTMAGPSGRSPAYEQALEMVLKNKRDRYVESARADRREQSGRSLGQRVGGFGRGLNLDKIRDTLRVPDWMRIDGL